MIWWAAHLEVVLIYGLGQVVDIHLPIQRKGCGALDEALDLCPAEVLGSLRQLPQVHIRAQEGVGLHLPCVDLRSRITISCLEADSEFSVECVHYSGNVGVQQILISTKSVKHCKWHGIAACVGQIG